MPLMEYSNDEIRDYGFQEENMELKGKKVIVIGERDGIQGPAIEACIKSAGAEPVLSQTQCFV